jgi:hypothetical protein
VNYATRAVRWIRPRRRCSAIRAAAGSQVRHGQAAAQRAGEKFLRDRTAAISPQLMIPGSAHAGYFQDRRYAGSWSSPGSRARLRLPGAPFSAPFDGPAAPALQHGLARRVRVRRSACTPCTRCSAAAKSTSTPLR